MRIAYLVHLNLGPNTGVYKKILSQVQIWKELGHSVRLFIVTRNKDILNGSEKISTDFIIQRYSDKIKWVPIDRIIALNMIAKEIISYAPDIVYTRRDHYYPYFAKLAKRLPVIVEINGKDEEIWLQSKLVYFYHKATKRIMDQVVGGFVFVTNELADQAYFKSLKKPKLVLGNGINLKEYDLCPISNKSPNPCLIFLGDGHLWHGIAKIFILANLFKNWTFYLIGQIRINKRELPANVILLPRMSRREYFNYLCMADVGIGSLALHRINMNEGSTLKVREYLAHGLPVISAGRDVDIPNGAEYYLNLPNQENNIKPYNCLIEKFVTSWKGKRVTKEEISQLDSYSKEQIRLKFLQSFKVNKI